MTVAVRRNTGFTLAEVLVASTISAFITLVAVGALKAVSDSAQVVDRTSETSAELRFAARMLARDLANLYRDQDPRNMHLVGASQTADDSERPAFLRFYAVGRTKARAGQPEGDVYEVEYVLRPDTDLDLTDEVDSSTLYRRLWPNPDREREPGGVLAPIAEGIDVFLLRFFDGEQWTSDWPEQMRSIPALIEVTLATLPRGRGAPAVETFTVSFARLAEGSDDSSGAPRQGDRQTSEEQPSGGPSNDNQRPSPRGR
jgi:general secretion pathway protein J